MIKFAKRRQNRTAANLTRFIAVTKHTNDLPRAVILSPEENFMSLIILDDKNIIELAGNDLIEKLDEFNDNLTQLLSTIYNHFTCGDPVEKFQYALKELIDYTSHYFFCEEQWMHLTAYDELYIHKNEHDMFTDNIVGIKTRIATVDSRCLLDELFVLIKRFTQHILVSDPNFREYIVNKA